MRPTVMQGFDTLVLELVRMLACPGESVLIFLPGIGEISEMSAQEAVTACWSAHDSTIRGTQIRTRLGWVQ